MEENASLPPNVPPAPPKIPLSPPPLIAPAKGQPRGRGAGWMVLALVLLVLLAVSVLFNLGHLARSVMGGRAAGYHVVRQAGPRLDEFVRQDNGAVNKVAVIEISGIIMDGAFDGASFGMVDVVKAQLKQAEEDSRVKAVILKVDSPGGEVLASDEIYRAVTEFQSKSQKPVVASMGSLAASGGYYVSAPCRWIVANDLTITGSIGVIMSSWNYRGLMDKVGVRPETYKSGKFKDMLSGSRDPDKITPEERQMIQSLIDETFAKFKHVVEEGRQNSFQRNKAKGQKSQELAESWQEYADGRVLSGTEAFRLGFVDELGGFSEAVARAEKLAGIAEANVVEYRQRYDFADLFRLFGKSEAKAVKIDMGMDLPRLKAGHLYLLSPTYLQ